MEKFATSPVPMVLISLQHYKELEAKIASQEKNLAEKAKLCARLLRQQEEAGKIEGDNILTYKRIIASFVNNMDRRLGDEACHAVLDNVIIETNSLGIAMVIFPPNPGVDLTYKDIAINHLIPYPAEVH